MTDPARWKLVALEALDGTMRPDRAYGGADGENALAKRRTIGRVTFTYLSLTLDRPGASSSSRHRPGDVLAFPGTYET